jgi:hypothetical protein
MGICVVSGAPDSPEKGFTFLKIWLLKMAVTVSTNIPL